MRKKVIWLGSSKADLLEFPVDVRRFMGHAISIAQEGGKHPRAKPFSGMGSAQVLEICKPDETGTYRTVYTVEIAEYIYILHAFQKKSKSGIATPKKEIDLIKQRLKLARGK